MKFLALLISTSMLMSCAFALLDLGSAEGAIGELGYSLNGNQELIADRTGPYVYSADTDGDLVHVLNATTGTEWWNISVGASPMSMDISSDDRYLYVAVSSDSKIVVIDLQTKSISKTIPLTFHPLSIRIGLSGRLYLTDIPPEYQSGGPKVIQESSGSLIEDLPAYGHCVFEMSPDKTILLMIQLGTSPTPLYKFSCAGALLSLLDEGNYDLVGNTRQIAVDWTNETIYIASPGEVERVSLATLDKIGSMPTESSPVGVALSPDMKTVFCTTMGTKDEICAFYASNGTLEAKYKLRESGQWIDPSTYAPIAAPPNAGTVIAFGKPVQFLNTSKPALTPGTPRADEDMGYNFISNIVADIFVGVPPCSLLSGSITLDGVPLTSQVVNQTIVGTLSSEISNGGNHTVVASLVYDGGSTSLTWNFTVSEAEHFVSTSPAKYGVFNYLPEEIVVAMDLGYPQRTITTTSITLNGRTPNYDITNGVLTIETDYGGHSLLVPGTNEVDISINFVHTDYMSPIFTNLASVWGYTIKDVPVQPSYDGLVWHNVTNKPSVMVPSSWWIGDDITIGGVLFDLHGLGPTYDSVQSVLTLQSGTDPSIQETEVFLDSFVDQFTTSMAAAGHYVDIVDGPNYTTISGHAAVDFGVRWSDLPIAQRIVSIVNEDTGKFWTLIMTVEASHYFDECPMFEGVVHSITLTAGGEHEIPGGGSGAWSPFSIAIVGIAAAVLAVFVFVTARDLLRRRSPPMR